MKYPQNVALLDEFWIQLCAVIQRATTANNGQLFILGVPMTDSPFASADLTASAFGTLMRQRHSCRAFTQQQVAHDVIFSILSDAQQTPSWCNAQPWRIVLVEGSGLEVVRAELMRCADEALPETPDVAWPTNYSGVYRDRKRACGWDMYSSIGIATGDRDSSARQAKENYRLFGAMHLAIVTTPQEFGAHGVMDCGAWVSNFMLAAAVRGVASVAQAAVASWPSALRSILPLPDDHLIVCGVSFGYGDRSSAINKFRAARAPLGEVVSWVS